MEKSWIYIYISKLTVNCVNLGKHPILSISTAGNYQWSQLTQLQKGDIVLSPIELCNTWETNSDFNKLLFISTIKDRIVSVFQSLFRLNQRVYSQMVYEIVVVYVFLCFHI